ncbi:MAG: hypothetical protein JWP78_1568 [Mucilaginibacter sp.]|nr:hypothetical protein [Mucilaginibacter sp.]
MAKTNEIPRIGGFTMAFPIALQVNGMQWCIGARGDALAFIGNSANAVLLGVLVWISMGFVIFHAIGGT